MKKKSSNDYSLVKMIILGVVDTAMGMYEIFEYPSTRYRKEHKYNKESVFATVSRLKKQGYLKEIESKGRKKYIATLKGKAKILALLKKDKSWDGKWRIVIFDIPEKKKKMRDFFREKLFELGFRKLQESVWICPYNISNIVEELIELCNARAFIHYLLVEELDNKDVLMKLFKLSGRT